MKKYLWWKTTSYCWTKLKKVYKSKKITEENIANNMETIQNIAKEVKNNFLVNAKYDKKSDHEEVNTKTVEEYYVIKWSPSM